MSISPIEATSEVAVTSYLQQARDWLATAVETTGTEQIAAAKAEIATAAEATKQLGLSREIREDAVEMVRRAEYALGKSIRKGQAEGRIHSPGTAGGRATPGQVGARPGIKSADSVGMTSPAEFFSHSDERRFAYGVADANEHEFDAAIDDARAEGNLSRANVGRKVAEHVGRPQRATRRTPLTDFAYDASVDLLRVAERLVRVVEDDRFKDNRAAIAQRAAGQINRAAELIAAAQVAINSETAP